MRVAELFRAPPVVPASLRAQNVPWMNRKSVTPSWDVSYSTHTLPARSSGKVRNKAFCKLSRVHAGLGIYPGSGRKTPIPAQFLAQKKGGGVSPAALMRQARGLTRT